jgi:hypothetical protein
MDGVSLDAGNPVTQQGWQHGKACAQGAHASLHVTVVAA